MIYEIELRKTARQVICIEAPDPGTAHLHAMDAHPKWTSKRLIEVLKPADGQNEPEYGDSFELMAICECGKRLFNDDDFRECEDATLCMECYNDLAQVEG